MKVRVFTLRLDPTTGTFSPSMIPPEPARLTHLGARLPQERVKPFIFDVRVVSNLLVSDVLQFGTPCTWRCRAGGQGRASLGSGYVGARLCTLVGRGA